VRAFEQLSAWPAPSVSVAVVGLDRPTQRWGPSDAPYALASVTKPLAAYAALIACDRGLLSLDSPAQLPGATLAHLLAHASGMGPDEREAMAEPGTRRIYSNAGYEAAADLVAEAVGQPFPAWLRDVVLEPLGMGSTVLDGSAAWAATSCVDDLAAFAAELLDPRLLDPSTYLAATSVAFDGLPGVLPGFGQQDPNDWGLGFELRDHKSPHWTGTTSSPQTFGHFGRTGTFLWVDPMRELACVALTDLDFGPWAAEAWPHFTDAVLYEA
jgi:CubicO group peptidase (beta-lactamase class C family)